MFCAALTHIFPPSLLNLFSLHVISFPACPVTSLEAALTAGVVEHHDVVHGDVAPPLPGDGRLDQHLQWLSGRKRGEQREKEDGVLADATSMNIY